MVNEGKKNIPPVDNASAVLHEEQEGASQQSEDINEQQELLREKAHQIFFQAVDWAKITGHYKNEEKKAALQHNVEQIREAVLTEVLKANLLESDEKGLEALVKLIVARENDRLNVGHKTARKAIAKICGGKTSETPPIAPPATPLEMSPAPKMPEDLTPPKSANEIAEEKEQQKVEELENKFGKRPIYIDDKGDIYRAMPYTLDLGRGTFRVFIVNRITGKERSERWSEEKLYSLLQDKTLRVESSEEEKTERKKFEESRKKIVFEKFPGLVEKWKAGQIGKKIDKKKADKLFEVIIDQLNLLENTDVWEEANKILEDAKKEIIEAPKGEASKEVPKLTEDEKEIARTGSLITLSRIKNWDELNANTEQDGDAKFLEKTRELWKEFAVHGNLQRDKRTGKMIFANYTDLDGKCALGLMELAGIKTKDIKYVRSSAYEEGRINLDTGDKEGVVADIEEKTAFIDHHGEKSKSDTSTAKKTYDLLVSLGLLQKTEYLDNLVNFVNQVDNADYPGVEKYFENSWRTIAGLNRFCSFQALKYFFEKDKNPDPTRDLSEEELKKYGFIYVRKGKEAENRSKTQKDIAEKSKKALPEMERDGFIIQSDKYGKICVEVSSGAEKNNPGGYIAAKSYGCNAYVIWNADSKSFFVSTDRELQEAFSQGKKIRDRMWIKPMHDKSELTATLSEILGKMTGGKFAPIGKLKEYLNNPEEYGKISGAKEPAEYELGEEGNWFGEKKKEAEKLPELGKEGELLEVGKVAKTGEKKKDGEDREKERKEKLKKIEKELIQARKDYLETDYKKKSAYGKLKKFFGTLFADDRHERLGEEDPDVAYYKKEYDKKLLEHKTFLLEEAVGKGIAGEKLGEKLKTIVLEENIALEDTEVEVRVENFEGRYAGFVKECVQDLNGRWEKMHWAEKTGVVVSVLGMASIAVGTGGAAAIGIGAAMLKNVIKSGKIPQFFEKTKKAVAEYYKHTLPVIDLENNLKLDPRIQESNQELAGLNEQIPKVKEGAELDKLVKRKQFLENQKDLLSYINNVVSIRSYIAGKNKNEWDGIAKKPIGKLLKTGRGTKTAQNEGSLEGRISRIYDNLKEVEGFKGKLDPLNEKETVDDWVRRLARIVRKGEISRI
ncbi:MAG: hypothetical protein CO141_01795 [Candidatus Moranbacteria bacterium CG_4_9_14_3_um_filter_42_9]|nr:MAG: hypothetical protein CO141_01795 [Candidatus Moranbacteria bacterium CG_4_9_14_3_um_filter_42_9]